MAASICAQIMSRSVGSTNVTFNPRTCRWTTKMVRAVIGSFWLPSTTGGPVSQPPHVLQTSTDVMQFRLGDRTVQRDARWATTRRVRTRDAAWSARLRTRKHAAMADHVQMQRLARWKTAAAQVRVKQGVRNTMPRVRICSLVEIRRGMATLHHVKLLVKTRDRTVTRATAGMATAEINRTDTNKSAGNESPAAVICTLR